MAVLRIDAQKLVLEALSVAARGRRAAEWGRFVFRRSC